MLKDKFRDLTNRLLEEIQSFYGEKLTSVVLFGSVARETFRFDSDIDFLIVAEDLPRGRMKRIRQFDAVEQKLETKLKSLRDEGIQTSLSPVFKTPEETEIGSPLFLDMVEDALLLFDRNDFFSRRLERLRKRLDELGAKRIWRGNFWYWVLKPDYKPGEVIEL